jgi:hypothetical protein
VVPALFLGTAVAITALVFIPLRRVRVEMDIASSAITFRTSDTVQLTGLSALTLLQAMSFAPTELEDPVTLRRLELTPPLELRPRETGSLTLSSVTIPAGTRVSIQRTADEGTWRLQIENAAAAIAATLAHTVGVSTEGIHGESIEFGRGAPLVFRAAPSDSRLQLDVTPANATSFLVRHNIGVTEVAFDEEIEESSSVNVGIIRGRASSVITGTIFNESLSGREHELRSRSTVEMTLDQGQVHELRLEPGVVHVNMSATARELKTGTPGALQTLRPSYLEWLAEHHGLKVAWGAAAWLFALALGGLKWWNAPEVHE